MTRADPRAPRGRPGAASGGGPRGHPGGGPPDRGPRDVQPVPARTYTLLDANRRPYQSAHPGQLGGHRGGRIYGRLDCPSARRAIARGGYVRDRVFFADEATALAAGYRACKVCLPTARRGS